MKNTLLTILSLLVLSSPVMAKLSIITATEDLCYLAKVVGGDWVQAESLSTGDQDLHMVEPRPSMVMKMKKADMVVRTGLDLDMWMDSLIAASRNPKVTYGAKGYVDASVGMTLLQVPTDKVDGSMGDVHIYGNPHYWLDPSNAEKTTRNILDGLTKVDPAHEPVYRKNREDFLAVLRPKLSEWQNRMAPFKGMKIVTYHNSWVYFAEKFGLEIIGNVEPKPGIPPTPSHLEKLMRLMKEKQAKVILVEGYFSVKGPEKISRETGAEVLVVPSSVGGLPEVKTYFDLFDSIIGKIEKAGK